MHRALRRANDTPPGPRGRPFVGVFLEARRDPLGFFLESVRRHGDVVGMPLGARRAYLLAHPEDVRHVLEDDQGIYAKAKAAARVRALFGDSLTSVDGEAWRRRRRLVRPAFRPASLLPSLPVVTAATARMLDRWAAVAERGEAVDALREATELTQAIIVELLFGGVGAAAARPVGEALNEASEHANRRLWSALGPLELPTRGRHRFRAALRTLDAFVSTMVARAREAAPPRGTVLAALTDAADAGGERMRDAELCRELQAMLFAGHTTAASALAWTWYVLSTHPAASDDVRAEVREVLGGRTPGAEDLPSLVRTRRVIEEVLRVYPPTWVTARTPRRDDHVRGHRIAAGSIVLVSPYVTHRHPAFWPDPERFDPDRFAPERRPVPFAYFPFGGGPRSCIGSWLASAEAQLVVAMVAQRFDLALAPGCRVVPEPGITLRPRPGVPVVLRRREP